MNNNIIVLNERACVIQVEDGTYEHHIAKRGTSIVYWCNDSNNYQEIRIPKADWQLLPNAFDVSEEVASKIITTEWGAPTYNPDNKLPATALEAYHLLLKSKNVLEVNPYGEKPDICDFEKYPLPICMDKDEEQKQMNLRTREIEEQWQQAEQYVGRYVLLIKNEWK